MTPNIKNQDVLYNAIKIFEMVGAAMMDFGFGSVIEKFEEYFGRKISKSLLALIGVTVVAGCLGVIATYLILPTYQLFLFFNNENPENFTLISQSLKTLIGIFFLIIVAISIVVTFKMKMFISSFDEIYSIIDRRLDDDTVMAIVSAALAYLEMSRDAKSSKKLLKRWFLARKYIKHSDDRRRLLQGTAKEKP